MRLKESKDNWKASNVLRKIQQPLAEPRKMHKAKNTRKWCKGKEGRLHDPQLMQATISYAPHHWLYQTDYVAVHWQCAHCHKEWRDLFDRNE